MAEHGAVTETALRSAVAERLGPDRFGLWFGEGVRLGVDGQALTVAVPNNFFRDWIRGHFASDLIAAAESLIGRRLDLAFQIGASGPPSDVPELEAAQASGLPFARIVGPEDRPGPPEAMATSQASDIRPRLEPTPRIPSPAHAEPASEPAMPAARTARRLDGFVVGPGSRLAYAAAVEMVNALGATFNPMFLHGGVGLGKSHLLEGMANAIRGRHPGRKIVQISAEGFTNGFLEALRTNALAGFRSRYRSAEVLIVDDVHFLASKRATVDEFLHTFNAVQSAGGAIILSADQHPRQIAKLTDELATRFLGGMVVKLDAPDAPTRRALLKAKAAARGIELPEAVVGYLADHLRGSVRELEGAVHSLIAHATLTGRRLDLELARSSLRDTIRFTAQNVALKDVERAVCKLFQISPEVLKSDTRLRSVTQPRMLAMYLARQQTGASFSEIGRFFGGRNHSTVMSATKKVAAWLEDEQKQAFLAGFESISEVLAAVQRELGA